MLRLFFTLAVVLLALPAATAPVTIPPEIAEMNLTNSLELFLDESGTLGIEDVTASELFLPNRGDKVQLGITDSPVWVRLDLKNASDYASYVLVVQNPRLENVQLYRPAAAGGWDVVTSGTDYSFYSRQILHPSPSFLVNLPRGSEQTWYLRIQNTGSMRFAVDLYRPIPFHQHVMHWTAYTFLLIGSFFAMTLYNFFIFLGLRERGYLYLSMLIAVLLLFQMSLSGTAHMYLWPNSPWWSSHSISFFVMIMVPVAVVFTNSVNNAYQFAPWLARLGLAVSGLAIITAGLCLTDWMGKFLLSHVLGFLAPLLVMAIAVRCWYAGYRPSGHFILAWSMGVVGTLLLALVGPGWMPSNLFTEHLAEIGFLVAVFLWSFTLSDRVVEKEERQRQLLERMVKERTAELSAAKNEVETLEGLLPICSGCKKIRDDSGYWSEVEEYIRRHTRAGFSHGLCPACAVRLYPDYFQKEDAVPRERG